MPKSRDTNQESFFLSQSRLPLQAAEALLALDAWEGSLKVMVGIPGKRPSAPEERRNDYTPDEIERLKLAAVYATDEGREKLGPFEEAGVKVSTLPRALAVYWSFREQAGDEPCLVISTGKERTRCSLIVGGEVVVERADEKELSLRGIWNSNLALAGNGPTRRVFERRLKDEGEGFEEKVGEGFRVALRTGKTSDVDGFPISSPIYMDGSLGAFRALMAQTVAASPTCDLRVRTVILSDWAAAHCNLRELLGAEYTVLRDAPRAAFHLATRGLMRYALAQQAGAPSAEPLPAGDDTAAAARPVVPQVVDGARAADEAAKPEGAVPVAEEEARPRREPPAEAPPVAVPEPEPAAPPPAEPEPGDTLFARHEPQTSGSAWRALVFIPVLVVVIIFVWAMRPNSAHTGNNETPTPTPTAEDTAKPGVGDGMVHIAGGDFMMGRDGGELIERPAHKITVDPFMLDAYEVTCEEYARFIKDTGWKSPPRWQGASYPQGEARHPVAGVTWDDANEFVRWRSQRDGVTYRLPTEEEWEFAARGAEGRLYPWGDTWREGAANIGGASHNGPVNVGSFKDGATPEGVYDLIGNVWEWTSSELKPYTGGRLPEVRPGDYRVMRGGAWDRRQNINATYRGYWHVRGDHDYSKTGFRCARDAPQGARQR